MEKICPKCGSECEREQDEDHNMWYWVCIGVDAGTCDFTEEIDYDPPDYEPDEPDES